MPGKLIAAYRRRRFAWLFVSLLMTLGLSPLLEAVGWGANAVESFACFNLAAAVYSLELKPAALRLLLSLTLITLCGQWALSSLGLHEYLPVSRLLWAFLALAVSAGILRVVLLPGHVDAERVFAALSLYILFGLAFGLLFADIESIQRGSLEGIETRSIRAPLVSETVYFSFVTLATLGYGDIVPKSPVARGLATVEAICGQLYLAVLVARLVSLYGADAARGKVRTASGADDEGVADSADRR